MNRLAKWWLIGLLLTGAAWLGLTLICITNDEALEQAA